MSNSENEHTPLEHRLPTKNERNAARQLGQVLAAASNQASVTLTACGSSEHSASIELGPALTSLLLSILEPITNGDTVLVSRIPSRLSSSHAADLLDMPRKKLISLIKRGELSSNRKNGQVRLKADDVLSYKRRRDFERSAALDALAEHDAKFL